MPATNRWRGPGWTRRAKAVTDAARRNPDTTCWRCNLTQDQHGRAWTAGHVRDGDPTSPLLPECERCNYSQGARAGNARRAQAHLTPPRTW